MEASSEEKAEFEEAEIKYVSYEGEHHLPLIMSLVDQELKQAFHKGKCVGTVVCKMGEHRNTFRGYIAMLVVIKPYRGRGIATELVTRSIRMMMESDYEEVTLEAEVTNKGALALYGHLGFIRAKRLFHYYLNGVDVFRLKLLFPRQELHYSVPVMTNRDEVMNMLIWIALEECSGLPYSEERMSC
ncbi:N-alpha-acetyltransferase MAK3-like [Durio zibethinus]|uniref:N-alpha-acetyltransferase MAK3-like n=1 Tax=Durio zibethinus TaxID=66656 RepID=A0A6P5ZC99_DURZI|nr:N-alpha-acetyltransferase MAK3-like [Durio zibethinus]